MSSKKYFYCDLCGSQIGDTDGIAIRHALDHVITAEWLHKDGCGHHLCNSCLKGLRGMFAALDREAEIIAARDAGVVE